MASCIASHTMCHVPCGMYNGTSRAFSELAAAQHTAVKRKDMRHGMATYDLDLVKSQKKNATCDIPAFATCARRKEMPLSGVLIPNKGQGPRAKGAVQSPETSVSTTPLVALGPNLRTALDPAGLPRGQSIATTTTKTHRQLAVFPNSHTCRMTHETTDNRQLFLPRCLRGPPT
jgi:hypothetical protein